MSTFQWLTILTSIGYLALLFAIAFLVEKKDKWIDYVKNSSSIYALSLAIYCTAWTFYGSIGSASKSGLSFLAIYIGPTLFMPFWYFIMRKVNRIAKSTNVTTFADFLSIRYSNSINLGMFITILMIVGIIPYISLQIKAISESFRLLMLNDKLATSQLSHINIPILVTIIMGGFIILFATQKMESSKHHSGIVASIAFESLFKLIAFLIGGIVITFVIFNDYHEIYSSILSQGLEKQFFTLKPKEFPEWAALCMLSGIAITLLPRQFQVSIIENRNEKHFKTALWAFPLYLIIINLFVIPVALGGNILLQKSNVFIPDYYLLEIPIVHGWKYISLIVFLGGFSAATAMIVIETVAMSNMLSNNLLIPLLLKMGKGHSAINDQIAKRTLTLRRLSVIIILGFTLVYYKSLSPLYSLVSIGLISFVFISQFFPSLLGALYLKSSHHKAVFASISTGFLIWLYTLIFPSLIEGSIWGKELLQFGPLGIEFLRPQALFGLQNFSPVVHSFFWSMLFNIFVYVFLTLHYKPTNYERQQAHLYVDVFHYSSIEETQVVWKEIASLSDLKSLMTKFLGEEKTNLALNSFALRYQVRLDDDIASDPKLIPFAERLLSRIVGTVSARILIESVIKDKNIFINEMMDIIQESKEMIRLNRELTKKSNELEKAKDELEKTNNQLILHDETKNEFLSTVSHELKSPLTSIRSFSEILYESENLSTEEISHFSGIINKESARISRLINQLLDLEKYDSGKQPLQLSIVNIHEFLEDVENAVKGELVSKRIQVETKIEGNINEIIIDRDKMLQVIINLLNNAIKFSNEGNSILIRIFSIGRMIHFHIKDRGKGIETLYHDLIFERFFQAKDQTIIKPKGSGLGLAISRKIVELHRGKIYVKESTIEKGSTFAVEIPMFEYL